MSDSHKTIQANTLVRFSELTEQNVSIQDIFDGASNQKWKLYLHVQSFTDINIPWDTDSHNSNRVDHFLRENGNEFPHFRLPMVKKVGSKAGSPKRAVVKIDELCEINPEIYRWKKIDDSFYIEFSWDIDKGGIGYSFIHPYPCKPILLKKTHSKGHKYTAKGYPEGKYYLKDFLIDPEVKILIKKPILNSLEKSNKVERGGKERSSQVLAATISILTDVVKGKKDDSFKEDLIKSNGRLNLSYLAEHLEDQSAYYFDSLEEENKNFKASTIQKHLSEHLSKYLNSLERKDNLWK